MELRRFTFPVPFALSGDQLTAELTAAGVACDHVSVGFEDDQPVLEVVASVSADADVVAAVVAAHVVVTPSPLPTIEDQVAAMPDPVDDRAGFESWLLDLLTARR